eukprot:6578222-Alexandrium_andersonii.AAC.1
MERAGALELAGACQHDQRSWQRDLTQDGDVEPEPGPLPAEGRRTNREGPDGWIRDLTEDGD